MSAKVKDQNSGELVSTKIPIYKGEDKISGKIDVRSRKKFDHNGIKVELIGLIEIGSDSSQSSAFMTNGLDLEPPGTKGDDQTYPFSFPIFQKPYESYYGTNVRLRYLIRVSILQSKYKSPIIKEQDIAVLINTQSDETHLPINLEVGIDDFLNIKIDFPKNTFELKEVIDGKISFLLVKLLIKKMEIVVVRKEIIGTGEKSTITAEDLCIFEIMDGCPIKGLIIRRRNPSQNVFSRN